MCVSQIRGLVQRNEAPSTGSMAWERIPVELGLIVVLGWGGVIAQPPQLPFSVNNRLNFAVVVGFAVVRTLIATLIHTQAIDNGTCALPE